MPEQRVTLRHIAERAGVHFTTVGRALKDNSSVPSPLAGRIREIAQQMGYKPDAMLSALVAYRNSKLHRATGSTIAIVSDFALHGGRKAWRRWQGFEELYSHALLRCGELGYNLEEFNLKEPAMSGARLTQILLARGINGLIVAPQQRGRGRIRLGWEHFSAVNLGFSIVHPKLHVVTPAQYRNAINALRKLRSLGYRRVGMVLAQPTDERVDHNWLAAYLYAQNRAQPRDRIPALIAPRLAVAELRKWLEKWRPEVILGMGFENLLPMIKTAGFSVPEEIGFISLATPGPDTTGIDENFSQIGAAAIDLVVAMIHRGERGIPKNRQLLLIEGCWVEGKTLLAKKRAAAAVTARHSQRSPDVTPVVAGALTRHARR